MPVKRSAGVQERDQERANAPVTGGATTILRPPGPCLRRCRSSWGRVHATLTSVLLKLGLRNTFMTDVRPLVPGTRLVGQAYTLRYIPMRGGPGRGRPGWALRQPDQPAADRDRAHHGGRRAGDRRPGGRAGGDDREHPGHAHGPARGADWSLTGPSGTRGDRVDGAPRLLPEHPRTTNVTLHHPVDVQLPVACGGVAVFPGDALVGDGDGVIVVPRHLAEEEASRALEQERRERFILGKVQGGASILGVYPPTRRPWPSSSAPRVSPSWSWLTPRPPPLRRPGRGRGGSPRSGPWDRSPAGWGRP